MKKHLILLLPFVLVPALSSAQVTESELGTDFGARLGLELDKKLAKGLHLTLEGQVRFEDGMSSLNRYQAGLGLSYKINPWLRVGGGYLFIERLKSDGEWSPRHRFYTDVTGRMKSGGWIFSLRERLQLTHRDGVNVYQTNPNAMALSSRLKAEYTGFTSFAPYAYTEFRLALNDPSCTATWNGVSFNDYVFTGYITYLNRVRGVAGVQYKINDHHALDFHIFGDYLYDKEIDTNKEGTKLKSLTYDRSFNTNIGFGYKFSF